MAERAWRTPFLVLTCGTIAILVSYGIRQSFGLFVEPVSSDFGWGRQSLSIAFAVQNVVIGLSVPFVGALADKFGAGRVVAVAAAVYALGLYLASQAQTPTDMMISTGLIVGLGVSGCGMPVILATIGRAVDEGRRSMFLGIGAAGGTAGQLFVVPVGQVLISAYGWATALVLLSVMAAMIVPLAAILAEPRTGPAHQGLRQGLLEALREARSHQGYWLLTLGFFVCGFQVQFIAMHLPAYLVDAGASAALGATAIALIGFFNLFGTYGCGFLGGRYRKHYLLSILYLVRSLVILAFIQLPFSETSVMVFASAMGILWLGTVPLTSGLIAQIFGTQYMGTLYGITFLSHSLGSAAGVWLGGTIYDATGSYDAFWWISIAAGLIAALLHWPIDDRQLDRAAAPA